MLFEPKPDDELIGRGIAIEKCLVRANDAVPVRLLNANGFPIHLKKGTPLGQLAPSVPIGVPLGMSTHTSTAKARFGVTREEHRDLFTVPDEYALAHCVARDLRISRGIASEFQRLFGQVDELKRQGGRVGRALELRSDQRRFYYLISKENSYQKPTYRAVWETLLNLGEKLLTPNVLKLAIPELA